MGDFGARDATQQEVEFNFQDRVRAKPTDPRFLLAAHGKPPPQVLYNSDTEHIRMIPAKARDLIALAGRTCASRSPRPVSRR